MDLSSFASVTDVNNKNLIPSSDNAMIESRLRYAFFYSQVMTPPFLSSSRRLRRLRLLPTEPSVRPSTNACIIQIRQFGYSRK